MTAIEIYLKSYDIKPSLQRIAIMDYLRNHKTHPTVDEIYNALVPSIPTLSKTTVYNTLKLFADKKAILSIQIEDKNLRFDGDVSLHAHFICLGCERIFDIQMDELNLLAKKEINDLYITETQVYYKGYCKECRKNTIEWI
jgi:Fur family ferric uptake transcriptional regulator/Fur family peroxide stress response transcriptional regulator